MEAAATYVEASLLPKPLDANYAFLDVDGRRST